MDCFFSDQRILHQDKIKNCYHSGHAVWEANVMKLRICTLISCSCHSFLKFTYQMWQMEIILRWKQSLNQKCHLQHIYFLHVMQNLIPIYFNLIMLFFLFVCFLTCNYFWTWWSLFVFVLLHCVLKFPLENRLKSKIRLCFSVLV